MSAPQGKDSDKEIRVFSLYILLAFLPLIAGVAIAVFDWPEDAKWDVAGQKGDYWGGHIAAFGSLTTVLLLLLTVWMQRVELIHQRKITKATLDQIEQTKQIHKAQEHQLERQAEIAEKAAIRTHLFELLGVRRPQIKLFLDSLHLSSYEELCHEVEHGFERLKRNAMTVIYAPSDKSMNNQSLRELDRYCKTMMRNVSFSKEEQKHISQALQLLPDEVLNDPAFFGGEDS